MRVLRAGKVTLELDWTKIIADASNRLAKPIQQKPPTRVDRLPPSHLPSFEDLSHPLLAEQSRDFPPLG